MSSPGLVLQKAMEQERPLQIAGVFNAYVAKLAEKVGFKAIYLSGAGVANAEFALPDLALTSLNDVLISVDRIVDVCELPLIVDADTGWGSPLNVERAFRLLSRAGAAGAHIEDQTESKRCGHENGKSLVTTASMVSRIKAAVDGRVDPHFKVIARTDAFGVEGQEKTLERALAYQAAGADAIFVEALSDIQHYQVFTQALSVPVLANMTEFGKTPLYSIEDFQSAGVKLVIYPQSAFRAMSHAALAVFEAIKQEGSQESMIDKMQTRADLYRILHFSDYEQKLNHYLNQNKEPSK